MRDQEGVARPPPPAPETPFSAPSPPRGPQPMPACLPRLYHLPRLHMQRPRLPPLTAQEGQWGAARSGTPLAGPGGTRRERQSLGGGEVSRASESQLTCRSCCDLECGSLSGPVSLSLRPRGLLGLPGLQLLLPQRPVTPWPERGKRARWEEGLGSSQPGRVRAGTPEPSLSPGPQGKEGGSWGGLWTPIREREGAGGATVRLPGDQHLPSCNQ